MSVLGMLYNSLSSKSVDGTGSIIICSPLPDFVKCHDLLWSFVVNLILMFVFV